MINWLIEDGCLDLERATGTKVSILAKSTQCISFQQKGGIFGD